MLGLGLGLTTRRGAAGPGTLVLGPGYLSPLVTFSRASGATDTDAAGALMVFGNDAPRYGTDPATGIAGWLLEGAATNKVRSPRGEGAVPGPVGGGGQMPLYWALNNANAGSLTVVGSGTEAGFPYVDLRVDATGAGNTTVNFEAVSGSALTPGALHTGSLWARIVDGSTTNFTSLQMRLRTDAATAANGPAVTDILPGLTASLKRFPHQQTVAADATAGRLQLLCNYSGAGSLTIRVGGPQLEANYLASSLILPPVGAPAAATRAADNLSITGAQFAAMFGAGAPQGCVIFDASTAVLNGGVIACVSDGTTNNRFDINANASGSLSARMVAAGAQTGTAPITPVGTLVNDTVFRCGVRWTPTSLGLCVNSGTVFTATTATPVFLQMRLGARVDGPNPLNGRIRLARALAYAPSDTEFQAFCSPGYPL